ncbi:MAG: helix-turn-helix transcriptional regulator [Acidobacteriota bacterium]
MKPRTFDDLYQEAESHDDYWVTGTVHELTEAICDRMEKQEISRTELARRLGTSPAYVTKILRGNANFTLATMVKLARALGCELRLQLVPSQPSSREQGDRPYSPAVSTSVAT